MYKQAAFLQPSLQHAAGVAQRDGSAVDAGHFSDLSECLILRQCQNLPRAADVQTQNAHRLRSSRAAGHGILHSFYQHLKSVAVGRAADGVLIVIVEDQRGDVGARGSFLQHGLNELRINRLPGRFA